MASKTGQLLLTVKQRKELVDELHKFGEWKGDIGPTPNPPLSDGMDIETKSGEISNNNNNKVSKTDGTDEASSVQSGEDRVSAVIVSSRQSSRRKGKEDAMGSGQAAVFPDAAASTEASITDRENGEAFGTGCLFCGADDDHANLLLCEGCNAEYHTYCLDPPLRAVPTGDWFCSKCKSELIPFEDDGLERLVSALSPRFTSRFGEVCWAQGGTGFGWWPSFIYDPRLTVGNARTLARKNLGKRHLVYFFECHDAPFAVLTSAKITRWEDGLMEDFHLGKAARAAGKLRTKNFLQALQAATVEAAKPIEMRMEWNHTDLPQILPSPQKVNLISRKRPRNEGDPQSAISSEKKPSSSSVPVKRKPQRPRGFPLLTEDQSTALDQPQISTRRNLNRSLQSLMAATTKMAANTIVESAEDGELFVKLLRKVSLPIEGAGTSSNSSEESIPGPAKNVGFVTLESRKSSTFAEARTAIVRDLVPDVIPSSEEWKFFVPGLGPVSTKQETSLGPMFPFLRRTTNDPNLGDGTLLHPLKIFMVASKVETS